MVHDCRKSRSDLHPVGDGARETTSEGPEAAWVPFPSRLTVAEREHILMGLARPESLSGIARTLQHSPSTISREVAAIGGQNQYSIWAAHYRTHS